MAGHLATGTNETERTPIWQDRNVRGIATLVIGAVTLVAIAYGVMVALTSPDGWLTKAANAAVSYERQAGASYGMADLQ